MVINKSFSLIIYTLKINKERNIHSPMEGESSSSFEDPELTELVQDPEDNAKAEEESAERSEKRKRGRPKIPDQWSRVINLEEDDLEPAPAHPLAPALVLADA